MGIIHVGCVIARKTPPSVHYIVHMEEFFGALLCSSLFLFCRMDGQTHQLLKIENIEFTPLKTLQLLLQDVL